MLTPIKPKRPPVNLDSIETSVKRKFVLIIILSRPQNFVNKNRFLDIIFENGVLFYFFVIYCKKYFSAVDFMDMDRLFKECERLNEKYLSFLIDICNISSKSDNKAGVDAVCEYCASFARDMEYDVEVLPINGSGNVMSATLNADAAGAPVCVSAHMDTVHPEGLFGVRREGDKLIGPGVYDCKGGIAVGFLLMEALKNCGYTSSPVKIILQSDEEVQSLPSNLKTIEFMCEKAKGAKAFFNLEGRIEGKITTSRKGILRYTYDITGIPVHAGTYFGGASAIKEAAHKILAIEQKSRVGGITYNCGIIKGGTVMNTVPQSCTVGMDIRIRTEEDIKEAEENLFAVGNTVFVEGTSTVTAKVSSRPPMERTDENVKLFNDILLASRKYGLGEFEENSVTGGSDAAYTTIAGIPTVDDLGPLGGDYHTTHEWIDINSISGSAKIIAAYIVG